MTVKVKSISGLENYASSIHNFAGKFETAANDTVRQFNTSLEGEKAEAINAFFKKLNDIQNTVFSEAPGVIRTFGQNISTFTDEIKGLGFSNLAYTDDDAMSKLVESLATPQRKEIANVKDGLVTLFNEAVEAMGEGDSNIGSFDMEADTSIASEILARTGTHTGIILADEALSISVSQSADTFISLTNKTRNARVVSFVLPSRILGAIKRGDFTKDDIVYLNRITTKEDAKILNSLLSDNIEDIDQIMENDPDKVSAKGYQNLAEVLTKWMNRSEDGTKKINRLLGAMGKVKQSKVKVFAENIDSEHTILKDLYAADMRKYEKSEKFDPSELKRRRRILEHMNDLSGLLAAVRVLKVGSGDKLESSIIYQRSGLNTIRKNTYERNSLFIQLNHAANPEWKLILTKDRKSILQDSREAMLNFDSIDALSKTTKESYTSHFESGALGALDGQFEAELTEIEEEHEKIRKNFKDSVLKNGVKGILEYVGGPIASGTFGILDSLSTGDKGDGIENTDKILEEIAPGRYKSLLKHTGSPTVNIIQDYLDMDEKTTELKKKIGKDTKNIYNIIVGQGGWSLEGDTIDETIMSSSEIYTDYSAYKRIDELNEKGVMSYFKSRNLVKPALIEIDNSFSDDPKMRTFLKGSQNENKKIDGELLTIQTMTPEQIAKMEKLIRNVKGTSAIEDFNNYFVEKFGN